VSEPGGLAASVDLPGWHDSPRRSRMDCTAVTDTCYQPTAPNPPRPCPARDKGREGCQCDTPACALVCCHAPARDPEAPASTMAGSNQPTTSPNRRRKACTPSKGKLFYGYRSLPCNSRMRRHCSLILFDDVAPRMPMNLIRSRRTCCNWSRFTHLAGGGRGGRCQLWSRSHLAHCPSPSVRTARD